MLFHLEELWTDYGAGMEAGTSLCTCLRTRNIRGAVYLFVHTKHSQKGGPFSVARLQLDLPFQNRLAYNRVRSRSASPVAAPDRVSDSPGTIFHCLAAIFSLSSHRLVRRDLVGRRDSQLQCRLRNRCRRPSENPANPPCIPPQQSRSDGSLLLVLLAASHPTRHLWYLPNAGFSPRRAECVEQSANDTAESRSAGRAFEVQAAHECSEEQTAHRRGERVFSAERRSRAALRAVHCRARCSRTDGLPFAARYSRIHGSVSTFQ